jgi:protein-S-isoprenylcysteine O-methyltransferase Ste14
MALLRHLAAILILPGTVTVLVPVLLVEDADPGPLAPLGVALIAAGLGVFAWTVGLFGGEGKGTLAPWDPTSHLVVRGPYRYVRNPMITAVLCILLGEAALFGSWALLAWAAIFLAANALWFPLVEEPGLRRRFGADYEAYAAETPRWFPRAGRGAASRRRR